MSSVSAVERGAPSWARVGIASVGARAAVVALAAVGHVAFLASILRASHMQSFAVGMSFTNAAVLAWAGFRKRRGPLSGGKALSAVVAASTLEAVGAASLLSGGGRIGVPLSAFAWAGLLGALAGLAAAAASVPLALALDHWRAEHTPRRGLDVWTTLAALGTVFAFVRPATPMWETSRGASIDLLGLLDACLVTATIALTVALALLERRIRRDLAAVRAGTFDGLDKAALDEVDAMRAPSWGLTDEAPRWALVTSGKDGSYRAPATRPVVAVIPAEEDRSWRASALVMIGVACVVGLGYRTFA